VKIPQEDINFRREVRPEDRERVETIVTSSGYFRTDDVTVATELVDERLLRGPESGYEFIFAEVNGTVVAYSCYGLIPCTLHSYDLYWIATHHSYMNRGIGRILLSATEADIWSMGGHGIYVETSSLALYAPTRAFYLKNGYIEKARLEDFYNRGDDKLIYVKKSPQ
jgi:ribosomal protein S18 acetylase RimI-like enzyme